MNLTYSEIINTQLNTYIYMSTSQLIYRILFHFGMNECELAQILSKLLINIYNILKK